MAKKVTLTSIFIIAVASLAIAGCTSPISNVSPNPSQAATQQATTQHDAFLEKYLGALQQEVQTNYTVKAWEVTWKNSTTADIEYTVVNKTLNTTLNVKGEAIVFASTEAATNYVNSLNKAGYSLASTVYERGGTYERITGHPPSAYKEYQKNTGETLLNYTIDRITQGDNLVTTSEVKYL